MTARVTARTSALPLIVALAVAAPAAAVAQIGEGGGDTVIEADILDVFNEDNLIIYQGRVDLVQGDTQIRTDRLEAHMGEAEGGDGGAGPGVGSDMGDLQRAIAIGNVFYVTPDLTARGDRAVYDVPADTVTLTGNVVVQQGCDVLTGDSVVMNMTTGNAQVRSETGRVRTVIRQSGAAQEDCE